ncbi:J domain-containing protein [Magnetospirillum sulfuroxidans]|uniref:J domain-containing protein n=1 Tax=Magnetospirillum sulfuroxidans TaxID=611300 RepID=A0ABS5IG46_9PROT|nr:J domain-containing protein [Magnetospirillum sulfuroxidans]MBR9973409.1 J domain-containing protein [Magnetospirillum sulfuroxidans]
MDGTKQEQNPSRLAGTVKHSYTIACSSHFRDAIEALATRRHVNVGDIARSVLLVMPPASIAAFADPGDPQADDRETVILKSGPSQGRPWRRKPRLQVRMVPGFDAVTIRRALGLALVLDRGELTLKLEDPNAPPPPPPPPEPEPEAIVPAPDHHALAAVNEELVRLQAIVNVLAFDPLPDGVTSRAEALHVLGFPPTARPDRRMVRARFRMLATIHHPDSNYGSHGRMSQLNQAMEFLKE